MLCAYVFAHYHAVISARRRCFIPVSANSTNGPRDAETPTNANHFGRRSAGRGSQDAGFGFVALSPPCLCVYVFTRLIGSTDAKMARMRGGRDATRSETCRVTKHSAAGVCRASRLLLSVTGSDVSSIRKWLVVTSPSGCPDPATHGKASLSLGSASRFGQRLPYRGSGCLLESRQRG